MNVRHCSELIKRLEESFRVCVCVCVCVCVRVIYIPQQSEWSRLDLRYFVTEQNKDRFLQRRISAFTVLY